MADGWIAITFFLTIGAVLITLGYFRLRARAELQQTVRAAVEHGRDLTPDLMAELAASLNPPNVELRRGLIAVAVGLAFLVLGVAFDDVDMGPGAIQLFSGISAFPFFIGVAYLILWRYNLSQRQGEDN